METTDQFSARAAVCGVIGLAAAGVLGALALILTGHQDQVTPWVLGVGTLSAPVAMAARITKSGQDNPPSSSVTIGPGAVTAPDTDLTRAGTGNMTAGELP